MLGQRAVPFLVFWGNSILFSTVASPVCIPTNSALGFPCTFFYSTSTSTNIKVLHGNNLNILLPYNVLHFTLWLGYFYLIMAFQVSVFNQQNDKDFIFINSRVCNVNFSLVLVQIILFQNLWIFSFLFIFIFKYVLLILLSQLSHFFSPLYVLHPVPPSHPHSPP